MVIDLINVPITYGSGKKGAEKGPLAIHRSRFADFIEGKPIYILGDIMVPQQDDSQAYEYHDKLRFLDPVAQVNKNLAHQVFLSLNSGNFPIVIGGDHSLGIGSIAGASKYYKDLDNFAVVWIDAHGDINTDQTSPSGNIHGMPLAASMNHGHEKLTNVYFDGVKVKPENVYIIGGRDIDIGEYELAKELDLHLYEMDQLRKDGIEETINKIIKEIREKNIENVHLSFDIDVMDPTVTPATGTPVPGGFTMEEGQMVLKAFLDQGFVKSLDFVELNPDLESPELTIENCNILLESIINNVR